VNGTVVEMNDATVEFECYTDEVGIRRMSMRIHNDSGEHCLIRLTNPKLFIIDDEEMELG
jgi:hypothetical protein